MPLAFMTDSRGMFFHSPTHGTDWTDFPDNPLILRYKGSAYAVWLKDLPNFLANRSFEGMYKEKDTLIAGFISPDRDANSRSYHLHQNFVCDIGRSVVGKSQCQIVSSRFPPIGLEIDSSAYYDPCGGRVFDDGFCVGVHISMKNIGKSHLVLIWESKGERRRFYLNIPFFQEIYDIRKTERGLIIGVNTHNGMSQEFHLDRCGKMTMIGQVPIPQRNILSYESEMWETWETKGKAVVTLGDYKLLGQFKHLSVYSLAFMKGFNRLMVSQSPIETLDMAEWAAGGMESGWFDFPLVSQG